MQAHPEASAAAAAVEETKAATDDGKNVDAAKTPVPEKKCEEHKEPGQQ